MAGTPAAAAAHGAGSPAVRNGVHAKQADAAASENTWAHAAARFVAHWAVPAVTFLDAVATGVMLPVAAAKCRTLGCTGTQFGLLGTLYGATQFLCGPLAGKVADTLGPLSLLLVSALGAAAGYLVCGYATTIMMLFLSRLLVGVVKHSTTAMRMIAVAQTSNKAAAPETDRMQAAVGEVAAASTLGYLVGPNASALLPGDGSERLALAAAALFVVASVVAWATLPRGAAAAAAAAQRVAPAEAAAAAAGDADGDDDAGDGDGDGDGDVGGGGDGDVDGGAVVVPSVVARMGAMAVYLVWTSVTICVGHFWVVVATARYDMTEAEIGSSQSVYMVSRLVTNAAVVPFLPRLLRKVVNVSPSAEAAVVCVLPMALYAVLVAGVPLTTSAQLLVLCYVGISTVAVCAAAGLLSWTAALHGGGGGAGGLGTLLGLANSVEGAARFGAPVMAGMLADATSMETMFYTLSALAAVTSVLVLGLGNELAATAKPRKAKTE